MHLNGWVKIQGLGLSLELGLRISQPKIIIYYVQLDKHA